MKEASVKFRLNQRLDCRLDKGVMGGGTFAPVSHESYHIISLRYSTRVRARECVCMHVPTVCPSVVCMYGKHTRQAGWSAPLRPCFVGPARNPPRTSYMELGVLFGISICS